MVGKDFAILGDEEDFAFEPGECSEAIVSDGSEPVVDGVGGTAVFAGVEDPEGFGGVFGMEVEKEGGGVGGGKAGAVES